MPQVANKISLGQKITAGLVFLFLVAIAGVFVLGGVAMYQVSKPEVWKEYSYPENNFKMSLPAEPTVESVDREIAQGVTAKQTTYTSGENVSSIVVIVLAFPESIENSRSSEILNTLAKNKAGAVTVISSVVTSFGAHPALDMSLEGEESGEKFSAKSKYIVAGDNLYMLTFTSYTSDSENYNKFIDSFKILSD